MQSSRWTRGWYAPVEAELHVADLAVEGALPPELTGTLIRIGPNPIRDPGPDYHWFSGEGMLHGIRLEGGRAAWYRNRWVRTPPVSRALGETPLDPPLPGLDAANTNVVEIAGRLYALTETCVPYRLDAELGTVGRDDWGGAIRGGFTAHPHVDPLTGEIHAVGYELDPEPFLTYSVFEPDGSLRRATPIRLGGAAAVHDLALTASHVLFYDLPLLYSQELAERGADIPYRWAPSHPPRIGVLPRGGGSDDVRWLDAPPGWVFHTMNAHDDVGPGGAVDAIVCDVVRFDRIMDADATGPSDPFPPQLYRWRIDLRAGGVKEEAIDGRVQEFPRIDERFWSLPYRYGYTTELMSADGGSGILAHDLRGSSSAFDFGPGRRSSEAVFAAAGETAGEGEGWLLAVITDEAGDRSELAVLDATRVAAGPVARVPLPQRVPAGFHGSWVPDPR